MSEFVPILASSNETPHQPDTVVTLLPDGEGGLKSAGDYDEYPLMQLTQGGRKADTIWLHEVPGQEGVGCISWFDIYRIKAGAERKTKAAPETITLYLRNADSCVIEGWNLDEVMKRLALRHVLQAWAFDNRRWPKPQDGKGVITAIRYIEAA